MYWYKHNWFQPCISIISTQLCFVPYMFRICWILLNHFFQRLSGKALVLLYQQDMFSPPGRGGPFSWSCVINPSREKYAQYQRSDKEEDGWWMTILHISPYISIYLPYICNISAHHYPKLSPYLPVSSVVLDMAWVPSRRSVHRSATFGVTRDRSLNASGGSWGAPCSTIEGEGAPPDFLGELFRFCEWKKKDSPRYSFARNNF